MAILWTAEAAAQIVAVTRRRLCDGWAASSSSPPSLPLRVFSLVLPAPGQCARIPPSPLTAAASLASLQWKA
ncbi:hypothetical protein PC123_g21063 [Phytophthora cactorum]|nr:hypothetical protein PC123_g21063 [Phytophthora cactorum]